MERNKGFYATEENLALRPGVRVQVSVPNPTGATANDPHVLLNETAYRLDRQPLSAFLRNRIKTYATYDGHNRAQGPDWYAIEFPEPVVFNSIDMTMECPHRDGGWWTSLGVEVRRSPQDEWRTVENLQIIPPYNFEDTPVNRRPYQTHALIFNEVRAQAVRIIGWPGGLAEFTFLARLAVYRRDLSRWNPVTLPSPPMPYIFHLISPQTIWDLSESLVKLTGLSITMPYLEHYLDERRYQRWWQRLRHNYEGEPELWQLLGASIGWDEWRQLENSPEIQDYLTSPREPYIRIGFGNSVARAVAPIVVENTVLGEMFTQPVILEGEFDEKWHRWFALAHDIAWDEYLTAVQRSPHMSLEQLEGAATLMGMIANTIANLAHKNIGLQRRLDDAHRARYAEEWRQMISRAIEFMETNLEEPVRISDVARSVALSPNYFSHIFSSWVGRTPVEFLTDLRIERAKEYLAHTSMSVMEVCVALGYNPSYFTRLFKRRTGLTPGQFARRIRTP